MHDAPSFFRSQETNTDKNTIRKSDCNEDKTTWSNLWTIFLVLIACPRLDTCLSKPSWILCYLFKVLLFSILLYKL